MVGVDSEPGTQGSFSGNALQEVRNREIEMRTDATSFAVQNNGRGGKRAAVDNPPQNPPKRKKLPGIFHCDKCGREYKQRKRIEEHFSKCSEKLKRVTRCKQL